MDIENEPVQVMTDVDGRYVADAVCSVRFFPNPRGGVGSTDIRVWGIRWRDGFRPGFGSTDQYRFQFARDRAIVGMLARSHGFRSAKLLNEIDVSTVAVVVPSQFIGFDR